MRSPEIPKDRGKIKDKAHSNLIDSNMALS